MSVMAVKSLLMRCRLQLRNRLKPYFEGKPVQLRSSDPGHTKD